MTVPNFSANWLAKSVYVPTISQLTQVVLVGSFSILMFLSIVGGAEAGSVQQRDFLDWDYAVSVWTTMKTREQGVAEWNRVVPIWEAWSKEHGEQLSQDDLATLEHQPNAKLIMQGHDMSLAYDQWLDMYGAWRSGRYTKVEPWHKTRNSFTCMGISALNIFTGKCNDMPDWRRPKDRAHDEKVYADYLDRMARKKAENDAGN